MRAAATSATAPGGDLAAARDGDDDAFRRLVEPHRAELHAHCYRMLGSLHDAEDALQDVLLRAWRGLPGLAQRCSLRSWLYRIATNTCLDAIARRPRRVLPMDVVPPAAGDAARGEPLVESMWVEPYPDESLGLESGYATPEARYERREAVELAFIAALQHLPGRQRAVLILREVLGFSAREVAEALETSVASVNSALQRARKAVEERLPDESQQEAMRSLGDERLRDLLERYMAAWEHGDIDALIALLAEDATLSIPPYTSWWRGREVIAAFAADPQHRFVPTRANGQLAIGCYRRNAETGDYEAEALEVLTLEGVRVRTMTAFMTPGLFARFGLPDRLVA